MAEKTTLKEPSFHFKRSALITRKYKAKQIQAPSTSGLSHVPFTDASRVRIPSGSSGNQIPIQQFGHGAFHDTSCRISKVGSKNLTCFANEVKMCGWSPKTYMPDNKRTVT